MKIHWSRARRTHERRRDEDHHRASRLGPSPDGPRLRDEGRSRDGAGRLARARGEDVPVLQPALPGAIRRRSRALAEGRALDRRDERPRARSRPARRRARGAVEYVCPMDPEVLETKPGPCPICGMALEPRTVTLADEKNPELEDMTRRFRVSLALTVPLLVARHGRDAARAPRPPLRLARRPGVARAASRDARSSSGAGGPSSSACGTSFRTGRLNMFTLIGIGTGIAWLYSLAAVLVPGVFPASFRGHDGEVGRYFESAAVIVTLVLMGQVLELRARPADERRHQGPPRPRPEDGPAPRRRRRPRPTCPSTTSGRATACASAPARRCRWTASSSRGRRSVDESMITGEPVPVEKGPGAARDRLHAQRHRRLRDARREGREGDAPRADRPARGRGPAEPRAHPAPRRLRGRLVRPRRRGRRGARLRRLGARRARAALRLRARGRGLRPHHRLPVRPRPRDADVDHGGRGPGGVGRRPREERGGPRDPRARGHPGRRQDRHPHRGPAAPRRRRGPRRPATTPRPSASRRASSGGASTRWRAPSCARPRSAASSSLPSRASRPRPAAGCAGRSRGGWSASATRPSSRSAGSTSPLSPGRAEAERREGRTVVFLAVDGQPRALLSVADPLKESAREAIRDLRAEGLDLVMLTGDNRTAAEAVGRALGIDAHRGRGAAGAQGRGRAQAPGRGPRRGHGRRRDQRRPRPRRGPGRHRDGHRHRRRHAERRRSRS